jgi:hypothetical protein
MPQKPPNLRDSVSQLVDELVLARQWSRPSILITIYRSAAVRRAAEELLMGELNRQGQVLRPISITAASYDILLNLTKETAPRNTVFAISGLRHGGGKGGVNAFHALNLRRELLVDRRLRVVFWLTEGEARRLPRQAPDFWAFRHRVVSLVELRARKHKGSRQPDE